MSGDGKALAIIPRTVDEVSSLAERFAKSALIPIDLRNKAADVFVTLLAGQELGLSPMAALRSIHVVKGKPILAADAMVGLALASGRCEYFRPVSKTATSVTYETKRVGSEPVTLTWSMEDATRAGLGGGDNWRKYPRAMLAARCKAELARDVYPDVLAGVYEEGEAAEVDPSARVQPRVAAPAPAEDVIDVEAEVVPAFDLDGAITALREAETPDELRKIASGMKAPESARGALKVAYRTRMDALVTEAKAKDAPPPAASPAVTQRQNEVRQRAQKQQPPPPDPHGDPPPPDDMELAS